MLELLIRMYNQILIGACCLSVVALALAVVASIRLLPALLTLVRLGLRQVLLLSFRLYSLILTPLASFIQQHTGVDVMTGIPRVVATLTLSLALGLTSLALTRLPFAVWSVGPLIVHGLIVGLVWDEIEEPGGLRLGARIR